METSDLLDLWSADDSPDVAGLVTPQVYEHMRRLAHRELRSLRPGDTLGTTALVHEAFVRLAERGGFVDERHALATAALAMRQILLDHYRRRAAVKRGGEAERVALEIADEQVRREPSEGRAVDVLALERALAGLASVDKRLAKLVVLRFYGGLTLAEAADVLEVSSRTAKRDWQKARLMLWQALRDDERDPEPK